MSAAATTVPASAIGTRLNTFTDASGLITTSVFMHKFTPAQSRWTNAEVLLGDSNMVVIGGGATGKDAPQGNLLTASYPNDQLTGWLVSSTDHETADPVELTAYVIGMKVADMTRDELLQAIIVTTAASPKLPHPEAQTGAPARIGQFAQFRDPGFVVVGGGFRVDFTGAGNLATASFPVANAANSRVSSGWTARSKDHDISDPSAITSYAICVDAGLHGGALIVDVESAVSPTAPHPSASATLRPGFAPSGVGADVHFNGDGNLLWKLQPPTTQSPTVTVSSKDHVFSDPSTITAYAIGIQIVSL